MTDQNDDSALVRKSVLGELTENARRWRNKASTERHKRQKWRKRALAAEAENKRLREALEHIRIDPHGHPHYTESGIRRPVPPGQCSVCAAVEAALSGRSEP